MTDPKDIRPVVGAALAVDRLLAGSPAWSAAQDAADALDALLLEVDRHWRDRYRTAVRENEAIVRELCARREEGVPRRPVQQHARPVD